MVLEFLSSSFRMLISNLIPIIFLVLILISSSPSFSLFSSSPAHPHLHPNAHTHLFFIVYLREATVTWSWEANLYICSTRDNSLIKTVKCSISRDKIFIQYTECIYQFFFLQGKLCFPITRQREAIVKQSWLTFFIWPWWSGFKCSVTATI